MASAHATTDRETATEAQHGTEATTASTRPNSARPYSRRSPHAHVDSPRQSLTTTRSADASSYARGSTRTIHDTVEPFAPRATTHTQHAHNPISGTVASPCIRMHTRMHTHRINAGGIAYPCMHNHAPNLITMHQQTT
ncbi:hypothetical protein SEA_MOLDEMORT_148 [Mycobacterium phage Moldemort]|nr:hypothetical protein SEA_MOLDEMORT_148 [Mycobacterium phage Moldemort]